MNPKDFKFDDGAFDDVFSSSDRDEFEDVFSDSADIIEPDEREDDGFEDIFSGRDSREDDYDRFADEYFNSADADVHPEPAPAPVRRRVPERVEKKPYSYNYNKAAQNKARRVSQDRIYDSVDEDVYSGKQPKEKKKKKKISAGKVIGILFLVLVLLVASLAIGGFGYAKSLTKKVNYSPLDANRYIDSASLLRKDGVRNILLVGVDAREGESAEKTRSDTMMLLTIDDNNKQLKLTSFLRDTYIDIPGYKWAKLNASQHHGGTQLLVDTLEYNYKVDIDNYMLVNFDMFTTIIDSLGGVEVEVTEKEAKYINSKDHMTPDEVAQFPEEIQSGEAVHLTGGQALWYARIRYLDSDFKRTERQRKIITAVINKAKKTNPVTLVEMVNEIIPMVKTDLSSDELMDLGLNSLNYISYGMAQQQIPAAKTYSSGKRSGQDVILIDLEKNQAVLKDFVFNKAAVQEETTDK